MMRLPHLYIGRPVHRHTVTPTDRPLFPGARVYGEIHECHPYTVTGRSSDCLYLTDAYGHTHQVFLAFPSWIPLPVNETGRCSKCILRDGPFGNVW